MSALLDTAGQPLLDPAGLLLLDTVGVDVTASGSLPVAWEGTSYTQVASTMPVDWIAEFVGVEGTLRVERLLGVEASPSIQAESQGAAATDIFGRFRVDWLAGKAVLGRFQASSSRRPVVSGRWPVDVRRVMPGAMRSLRMAYNTSARNSRAIPVEILSGRRRSGVMPWASRGQPTAMGTMPSTWSEMTSASIRTVEVEVLAETYTGWLSFPIEALFRLYGRAPFPTDWDGTDIIRADTDYIITSDPRSFLISAKRRYFNVPRPGVVVFKQPWEEVPLIFDFNEWLEELAAQVTFQAIGTIFVTPSGLTVGTASDWVIDGLRVQIPARGGTAGTSYTVTCRIVVLGTGEAFVSELDALVLVADR